MATPQNPTGSTSTSGLPARLVYVISAASLVLGVIVGYFWAGGTAPANLVPPQPAGNMASSSGPSAGGHPKPTLEQMKQLADVQASGLIEKSKADPGNVGLLVQIAGIYQAAHQFKEAAEYFNKALKVEPKNVSARTQLASCLYYSGDTDGAILQLNQALKYDPKDTNALFNLGMIKYQGRNDPAGAIATWQALLKANPNLDRRPIVEKMIAEAKASAAPKQ